MSSITTRSRGVKPTAATRMMSSRLVVLVLCLLIMATCPQLSQSLAAVRSKGSAKVPLDKKKVGVLGGGGNMGGVVFGFLQRAGSLWGTGMGKCSTMGACADTAVRLNRMLSKTFCLAVADESMVRLTNLKNVEAIQYQLKRDSWDAIILGSSVRLAERSVTGGTYETSPNDKAMEVYWDAQLENDNDDYDEEDEETLRRELVSNVIQACQQSETIQHIVAVDTSTDLWLERLLTNGNVPYTCLIPKGNLQRRINYTYRSGIASQYKIQPAQENSPMAATICAEEFAAIPVQCLQSLDWSTSRTLDVSCLRSLSISDLPPPLKRPDQEWCVQSNLLEDALSNIS